MPVHDSVSAGEWEATGTAPMASAFRDALIAHGYAPEMGTRYSLEASFDEARSAGCQYVLQSAITEWENGYDVWWGYPDKAAVSVNLYDATTKELVGGATHRMEGAHYYYPDSIDRFLPELAARSLGKILGWR